MTNYRPTLPPADSNRPITRAFALVAIAVLIAFVVIRVAMYARGVEVDRDSPEIKAEKFLKSIGQ